MDRVHLPYTLLTWVGMVTNSGLPAQQYFDLASINKSGLNTLEKQQAVILPRIRHTRYYRFPLARLREVATDDVYDISSFQDYIETDWSDAKHAPIAETVIACLRTNRMPDRSLLLGTDLDRNRFAANILACRNPKTDIHRLMTFMKNRNRLTLEQAAGAVVSALVSHGRLNDTEALVRELTGILAAAHMSIGWAMDVSRNTLAKGAAEALAHAAVRAYARCSKAVGQVGGALDVVAPRSYRDLARLLLRVRSARPATRERCLVIPRWIFEAAGIEPSGGHAVHLNEYQAGLKREGKLSNVLRGYQWPENPAGEDSIVLSKHSFRTLQRSIFRLYRFWDAAARLRRRVAALEDRVIYASAWVDQQLRETDDVAKVAFWFFAYQRRLQLKVVSDGESTRFLAKGEGAGLYQNNLTIKSTFEQALARIAGLEVDSVTHSGDGETLALIDKTCLLMKEYVDVYGRGKKENLVFKKGVTGGKGRGAVNAYNMLCYILRDLKARAKEEGLEDLPGPVYKFLAKDLMHRNESWDDDAFANGKVHGWEEWAVKRGLV